MLFLCCLEPPLTPVVRAATATTITIYYGSYSIIGTIRILAALCPDSGWSDRISPFVSRTCRLITGCLPALFPSLCLIQQARIHHLYDKVRLSSADLVGTHCDLPDNSRSDGIPCDRCSGPEPLMRPRDYIPSTYHTCYHIQTSSARPRRPFDFIRRFVSLYLALQMQGRSQHPGTAHTFVSQSWWVFC